MLGAYLQHWRSPENGRSSMSGQDGVHQREGGSGRGGEREKERLRDDGDKTLDEYEKSSYIRLKRCTNIQKSIVRRQIWSQIKGRKRSPWWLLMSRGVICCCKFTHRYEWERRVSFRQACFSPAVFGGNEAAWGPWVAFHQIQLAVNGVRAEYIWNNSAFCLRKAVSPNRGRSSVFSML